MPSEETEIAKTWSNYWKSHSRKVTEWDTLSQSIYSTLLMECDAISEKQLMEAGCGTARINVRLAKNARSVTCLDISPEALEIAKGMLKDASNVHFELSSILSISKTKNYDIVWNAGVLEHFNPADQEKALNEFLSILNPDGKVIIFTPFSRCVLYRFAKFLLEKTGIWPYGREIPISSLEPVIPKNGVLKKEYTISFLPLIFDSYKWLPPLRLPGILLSNFITSFFRDDCFFNLDRICSRIFGGYLLVSVIEKR